MCFQYRDVHSTWVAKWLRWCVDRFNGIRIARLRVGVEGSRAGSERGNSDTKIRITCHDTAEASSVAVSSSENAASVNTECRRQIRDEITDKSNVVNKRVLAGRRPSRIRLEASGVSIDVHGDAIRIHI